MQVSNFGSHTVDGIKKLKVRNPNLSLQDAYNKVKERGKYQVWCVLNFSCDPFDIQKFMGSFMASCSGSAPEQDEEASIRGIRPSTGSHVRSRGETTIISL